MSFKIRLKVLHKRGSIFKQNGSGRNSIVGSDRKFRRPFGSKAVEGEVRCNE
jgi:hypothetical protein